MKRFVKCSVYDGGLLQLADGTNVNVSNIDDALDIVEEMCGKEISRFLSSYIHMLEGYYEVANDPGEDPRYNFLMYGEGA